MVTVPDSGDSAWSGWKSTIQTILMDRRVRDSEGTIVVAVECYPGVHESEIVESLNNYIQTNSADHRRTGLETRNASLQILFTRDAMKSEREIDSLVAPFNGGEDPIFGWITALQMGDFFDSNKLEELRSHIQKTTNGLTVVIGIGATLIAERPNLLVYADMPRWEAQLRMRRNEIANIGTSNFSLKWSLQYKRAFFTDWRVADRHKRQLMERWDYVLDTTVPGEPRLVTGNAIRRGLELTTRRPFRVVPFFDPAPWGGTWMERECGLEPTTDNYGWCFDCVPEENSLRLQFGTVVIEIPSINVVFFRPKDLLGDRVYARFGDEFPIRFDLLDTIEGGNLSFQVHPLTGYIQNHFGMHYTQDESYYMLDAASDASVYLGLREQIDSKAMLDDLAAAARGEKRFEDERFVNRFHAQRHDHFLIPAGTVHCSGAGSMVLEISATPYIFTFKMWDWGRFGLDGLPRPINLERGTANIQWDRTTSWVERELLNRLEPLGSGEGWREERTGLHELQFIETRRHWFTGVVHHETGGSVNVLNLVQGDAAVVESATGAFDPFIVHFAETFIIPASVGQYTIRPYGTAAGTECATMKALVRMSDPGEVDVENV
jgi:mannose-6-phosphate isomerase class I